MPRRLFHAGRFSCRRRLPRSQSTAHVQVALATFNNPPTHCDRALWTLNATYLSSSIDMYTLAVICGVRVCVRKREMVWSRQRGSLGFDALGISKVWPRSQQCCTVRRPSASLVSNQHLFIVVVAERTYSCDSHLLPCFRNDPYLSRFHSFLNVGNNPLRFCQAHCLPRVSLKRYSGHVRIYS